MPTIFRLSFVVLVNSIALVCSQTTWKISAFESCYDGCTPKGNCTTVFSDGALQAISVSTVLLDGKSGYLDFGNRAGWGCPYDRAACPEGFQFFGWFKFRGYPRCDQPAVLMSTMKFNIHLLGNGHLVGYVWTDNTTEYYVESEYPVVLDVWYGVVLQFNLNKTTGAATLSLVANGDLYLATVPRCNGHTYDPPTKNFLYGSDGNGAGYAHVQMDRHWFSYPPVDFKTFMELQFSYSGATAACTARNGVTKIPLHCYYLEMGARQWTDAYKNLCAQTAWNSGYPVGRLAWIQDDDETMALARKISVEEGSSLSAFGHLFDLQALFNLPLNGRRDFVWNSLVAKLATYGNASSGYTAWLGGGKGFQWLDKDSNAVSNVTVPASINATISANSASNNNCLSLNTKTSPWQWSEIPCNTYQPYVCEMSWPCLLNPCQNHGVCSYNEQGKQICQCWPGTSGRYCEIGTPPMPTCLNSCSCPAIEHLVADLYPDCATAVKISDFDSLSTVDSDGGFITSGNASVIVLALNDSALKSRSPYSVLIKNASNAFLDFGLRSGCPYDLTDTCQYGFAYFGWLKFLAYPTPCSATNVIVTTEKFNLHLLGNGHLAVYVWQRSGWEYYLETSQPVPLNLWLPIVVNYYASPSGNGKLEIWIQGQLYARSNSRRQRTYTPPSKFFMMGSDGRPNGAAVVNVQYDTAFFSTPVPNPNTVWKSLIDVDNGRAMCALKNGFEQKPLNCYWLEQLASDWNSAYAQCNRTAAKHGFPIGRLAWFDKWESSLTKIAAFGNGTETGFVAWLGGGRYFQKLTSNGQALGQYPISAGITKQYPASSTNCMVLNTTTSPWKVTEMPCNEERRFICQATWPCLVDNPCQNQGVCIESLSGQTCQCRPGTSGPSCEYGTPYANCANSCACSAPNQPAPLERLGYCYNAGPWQSNLPDLAKFYGQAVIEMLKTNKIG